MMTKANREDSFSTKLDHIAKTRIKNIVSLLKQKIDKCNERFSQICSEMEKKSLEIQPYNILIENLKKDRDTKLAVVQRFEISSDWKEKYWFTALYHARIIKSLEFKIKNGEGHKANTRYRLSKEIQYKELKAICDRGKIEIKDVFKSLDSDLGMGMLGELNLSFWKCIEEFYFRREDLRRLISYCDSCMEEVIPLQFGEGPSFFRELYARKRTFYSDIKREAEDLIGDHNYPELALKSIDDSFRLLIHSLF
jgi:hypothetical protein